MFEQSDFAPHPDVMVSSTYLNLKQHRQAVCDALLRLGFFPVGMEYDSAKAQKDIIASSMEMVRKARAYIGILGQRYGGVPLDNERNPDSLSITELEYRAALKRGIPVYVFLMNDQDLQSPESEPEAYQIKLQALKADARSRSVCPTFSSVEELRSLVLQSMAELRMQFASKTPTKRKPPRSKRSLAGPSAPNLLALPNFIYGHEFVGRAEELAWLNEWSMGSDSLVVFEAIGGTGKSTLAWKWLTEQAAVTRPDFAGRFWYSFYEGGADMTAFAASALSYVTGQSIADYRGRKTSELAGMLLAALRDEPFLLVLDGLERVLVAYHRLDASQARDDEVASSKDDRACIKPGDGDLLRQLVAAGPSKILITSRLLPTALLNKSGQLLPGVRHRILAGLSPDDALTMMRNVGVRGDVRAIKGYLAANFDNHPQIVGIVGGLVKDYIRDPGNFDEWAADQHGGAALHLSKLDLVQRQTHILSAALNGLEPGVRQVLSRIAAIGSAVPFETVEALNPYLPPAPPAPGGFASDSVRDDYEREMSKYLASREFHDALPLLVSALQDLGQRGLLQWDRQKNTYDLHPVVRGYAFDVLEQPERADICARIADHFRNKPPDRYGETRAIGDVQQSMNIFRALVQAARFQEALRFYRGDFANALSYSIEAHHEIVALLKPFFPTGFADAPTGVTGSDKTYLLNNAAVALIELGRLPEARAALTTKLRLNLDNQDFRNLRICLTNLGETLRDENKLAQAHAVFELALKLVEVMNIPQEIARVQWYLMTIYRITGQFKEAEAAYDAFRQIPPPVDREIYRIGEAEEEFCWLRFYQGRLTDKKLRQVEEMARSNNNRNSLRSLIRLRGELHLEQGDPAQAIAAFESAIEMAQAVGLAAGGFEARLGLAKSLTGETEVARDICDRLHQLEKPPHIELAAAYVQIGNHERAHQHAVSGYTQAWADGPPYSHWWELRQCRLVLQSLGEAAPGLAEFDPTTVEPVPYRKEIVEGIKWLKTNRWAVWG